MRLLRNSQRLASFALLCAGAIACASGLPTQTPPDSFEDLAARARADVDSNPAEAVILFQKALALRPEWVEGWFYMGSDLFALRRHAEARDAFRRGLALSSRNGTAYGFLGLCEHELGDFDQALADLNKSETLGTGPDPDFELMVRQHAALILIRQQAFDEAIDQLGPLSRRGANSPEVTETLGLCALAQARQPETLSARAHTVANLAGKALWANLARSSAEAEERFHELVALYPDEPGVHYAHGVYQMEIDQHAALDEFEKELKANPAHWPSMLVIAFLRTRNGEPEAGLQMAQKAMELQPARQRWVSHIAIGHAYLNMGQPEKAIPELEAAVKQQPANTSVHFYLEKAYRLAGRKEDAQREKAEFVRLKAQEDPLALPGPAGMGRDASRDAGSEAATGPVR
jgi:tetratricopeptide (TPR) repeat protein